MAFLTRTTNILMFRFYNLYNFLTGLTRQLNPLPLRAAEHVGVRSARLASSVEVRFRLQNTTLDGCCIHLSLDTIADERVWGVGSAS
jgi:hypothetical protein